MNEIWKYYKSKAESKEMDSKQNEQERGEAAVAAAASKGVSPQVRSC